MFKTDKILKLNKKFYIPVKNKSKVATTRISDKGLVKGNKITIIFNNDENLIEKLSFVAIVESIEKIRFSEIIVFYEKLFIFDCYNILL